MGKIILLCLIINANTDSEYLLLIQKQIIMSAANTIDLQILEEKRISLKFIFGKDTSR